MLELRSVSYRYPGYARLVLSDVNLRIASGEIVGLVGRNESGKSTLCLVASGLAPGSVGGVLTGEVLIDSMPTRGLRPFDLAQRVGLVFQNPNTQRSGVTATVFEEVALGPVNLGLPVADSVERTRWALDTLKIEDLADRDPAKLSGGQAQLVAIASILAMRPAHLVLDEPTAQLDPEGTRLVGQALTALATTGSALLVAEHKTDLLDRLCSRVVAVDGGAIAMDGPAASVLGDPNFERLGVERPARYRIADEISAAGLTVPGAIP
ncbi:MAG TPA: ABC transporter ATP-binding protein [Gaiellaceae bacterium]|nr:ABC transporter ATP-binding protein [Gaiellaceae bacterium]